MSDICKLLNKEKYTRFIIFKLIFLYNKRDAKLAVTAAVLNAVKLSFNQNVGM